MRPIIQAALVALAFLAGLVFVHAVCGQHPASCQVMKPAGRGWSIGSAGLIGPNLVATNHHVCGSSGRVKVVWPNKVTVLGTVIGSDAPNDVAIVKLDKKRDDIRFFLVRNKFPKPGSIGYQDGAPHGKKWITRQVRILNYPMGYAPVKWAPYSIPGDSGGPVYSPEGAIYALCKATAYPRANESVGPSGYRICQLLGRLFGRGRIQGGQFCPPGMICPRPGGFPQYPGAPQGQVPGPPGAAPGGGSPIPVEPMDRVPDVPDQDDYAGPAVPRPKPQAPQTVTIDLDALAEKLIEKMAGDERFKGEPGKDGAEGKQGPEGPAGQPGQPADPADLSALTERLNALQAEIEALRESGITVVFEGGDDTDEESVSQFVKLGKELVIPAIGLRVNNVDQSGAQMYDASGDPQRFMDVAPLGGTFRYKFRQPQTTVAK